MCICDIMCVFEGREGVSPNAILKVIISYYIQTEETYALYLFKKMSSFSGDSRSYISNDSGDLEQLVTVPALKTIVLKKECPVMLLVYLSNTLVNGTKKQSLIL